MVPDEEAFKWAMSGCAKVPPIATADDSIESPVESWAVRIEPGNFRSTSCGRCSVRSSVNHTDLDGRPSNYIMTHYVACLGICAKFSKDRSGVSAALPDQVLEFEGGKKPSWKPSMLAGNVLYLDKLDKRVKTCVPVMAVSGK